ncbi:DUF349 domain-containing protein [Microvirga sp. STS02]|uniref:DUF349 domain-containing protein n=1 Tax=Hymenobacter negativus TaxID=2795026 RepID=UPI0018DBDB15|nr:MULTISPECIES: DUF349 domain-containing protein [Bacteria]MBH8569337.1 DUF349 domain-containing protein [Hymenobacter negativus]MBR7209071.1 DUF349 domain-containing protein [Microvirga sp. STS02]
MAAEENPTAPLAGGPDPAAEDRMSILQRRLAEIQSKSAPAAPAADAAPSATPTPNAAGETQVELPAQGTPDLAAGQPDGAGTAEAPAAAVITTDLGSTAPAPGTPEAAAAAETAQHVPDSVTVDGSDISAPQARAVAHYGEEMATTPNPDALPAAEHIDSATPAPIADPETLSGPNTAATIENQTAELPTVELHDAPELEAAQEPLATLPTSSETPLDAAPADVAAIDAGEEPTGVESEGAAETVVPDFTALDLPAQANYLVSLLRSPNAGKNRKQISDLTRQYETNVGLARTAAREKFAAGGEGAEAFAFQQPEGQQELNKALQEFRESRAKDAKAEDASRGDNLIKKKALLDQLRTLVDAAETKDSSAKLKALQAEWKATGAVPQSDSQGIWDTYHGLLDIYYSKQGQFLQMKDLDRRRNQEAKEALIKRAEALGSAPGINKALDELTKLHEDWKNIGPVPNDQREPLWQRFIAASDVLHQRRKEFVDQRSTVEKANLVVKQALLERVLPFATFDTDRVNLWRSKTDELQEIKTEWEAAGLVPRAQADALNKQYWAAYKAFFNRKNDFFKSLDNEKSANVKAKQALIDQAEEAANNPDGDAARQVIIRVQKEWKDVGRVPDKLADKLWHRFRAACDAVFERPKQEARVREEKVQQSSAEQTAHLDKIAEQVNALTADAPGSLEGFRAILAGWATEFDANDEQPNRGTADRSEEQLLSLLGKYLDHVPGLSYADRTDLLFQTEVARLKARPQAQQQLTRKEMALRKEINELENDAATLQTNLDFFARSKNATQLREEYQGRIAEGQKRIEALKKQLRMIRS